MNNTTYSTGSVSVAASGTTVTGSGTAWLSSGIRAGDLIMIGGLTAQIGAVSTNTSLTLKRAWPGAAQSGANYDIIMLDDEVRGLIAANALLQALSGGTLTSLGQIAGAANQLPYWTGTGVMSSTGLTSFARSLLDDADASALWATIGATSGPAQAFRRGNILGPVSQSGGVPTGAVIERGSNANGDYVRFADGTQICTRLGAAFTYDTFNNLIFPWTYPAPFSDTPVAVPAYSPAGSDYVGLEFSGVGITRHQGGTSSANFLLSRSAGAPVFAAGMEVRNVRLVAIGRGI